MTGRQFPIGAELVQESVDFRVWAPDRHRVAVQLRSGMTIPLASEDNGYFSGSVADARANDLYFLKLDHDQFIPDPASRFQPDGPHGLSQIIDPSNFEWSDSNWIGRSLEELVIYELHVGTFTEGGTWTDAAEQLGELALLGITCIEVMPVAEFPGSFGWGYDGVDLFAPSHLYGTPNDFRHFVNMAHLHGIAVILDVVYNHLGPDGNYLRQCAAAYFTDRYRTDWGEAINFDGPHSGPVREFVLTNAAYWIKEFHLDGLRLDATQNIYDESPPTGHIITEIGVVARVAAPHKRIIVIAENEPQNPNLCRPVARRGFELDAVWNDDFHHSAMVALNGRREAYFQDYVGSPQEFISTAKYGFLFQGQWYSWQQNLRGQPSLDLPPTAFVSFLQNHDQIANSERGLRAHQLSSPARYRALLSFSLLQPTIPLLFQGQEFSASSPFLFFADHKGDLVALVQQGRVQFLSQFPRMQDEAIVSQLANPHHLGTFRRCKLKFSERETHASAYQLTRDLLRLRRRLVNLGFSKSHKVDGSVINQFSFLIRIFADQTADDRLLVVNLGADLELRSLAEPLLVPPGGAEWKITFSSESAIYGGDGVRDLILPNGGIFLSAETAMLLEASERNSRE